MAIKQELVEEIRSRANIVDVVSTYIPVTKKGRNHFAVCPFHDDHNPSLSISEDKQIFKCFVCGAAGDVFGFVSKYDGVSYEEAIRKVASLIGYDDPGLHVKSYERHVDENLVPLYGCITDLHKFYQYGLSIEEGEVARKYLEDRQISADQIAKFGLGYALKDGTKSINYLKEKGYSLKNIEDIGISYAKLQGMNDSNAGRLIFPIKDASGQVVGFSARRIEDNDTAKYVNSPETKIFSKGNILYNMDNAKTTLKHDKFLYVVEGFMDVFAIDSLGINSVVGLMGTAMTKANVEQLKRLNVEIRLCLDGDKAGQIAMMEIIKMFDAAGISYRLVSKPGELKDADEILKKEGPDALRSYINTLVDPFTFALNYYENVAPLGSVEERKKVISHFGPMLVNAKTKIELDNYIYRLATVTNFEAQAIRDYVEDLRSKKTVKEETPVQFTGYSRQSLAKINKDMRKLTNAESLALKLMLSSKEAVEYYEKNIKYFYNEVYLQIANYLSDYVATYGDINVPGLITQIEMSDNPKKEDMVNELTNFSLEKEQAEYNENIMNDCNNVIQDERRRIYERKQLLEASVGKSNEEKARMLDDYLKRTNKIE